MGRTLAWVVTSSLAVVGLAATVDACGSFGSASDSGDASVAADAASGTEGGGLPADEDGGIGPTACGRQNTFGTPVAFPSAIDGADSNEYAGFLSSAKTLYLASDRGGTTQIYRSMRPNVIGNQWSMPALVAELSAGGDARNPNLTRDEQTIYFDSKRSATAAIYVAKRTSTGAEFTAVTPVTLDGSRENLQPWIAKRGLYFASRTPGGKLSIWFAKGDSTSFGSPVEIQELRNAGEVQSPVLTDDELTIFFSAPGAGNLDIFTATRASVADAFGPVMPVAALSTNYDDYATWVSSNGCAVIVETFVQTKADLFYATRSP